MAKPQPGPVFTLQPATRPTWWQAHRHQVLSTAALIGGFVLGSHSTDNPPDAASNPQPAHTAPADHTNP